MILKEKLVNIGIVGFGVIGTALKNYLSETNKQCKFLIVDPPKNYNDDLNYADVIFVNIHIPTENHLQDLTLLKNIIQELPDKPIFIRTTVLPGTCDKLAKEFKREIYFMPEFLTERTANSDFTKQPMIFTGRVELLQTIFKDKKYIFMSNIEAELTKYAHNVFGALKVTYFNEIYNICKNLNCSYENVHKGFLLSGYINDTHTYVPGPDGKLGYGGKCFPKDIEAFSGFVSDTNFKNLLQNIEKINKEVRGE